MEFPLSVQAPRVRISTVRLPHLELLYMRAVTGPFKSETGLDSELELGLAVDLPCVLADTPTGWNYSNLCQSQKELQLDFPRYTLQYNAIKLFSQDGQD